MTSPLVLCAPHEPPLNNKSIECFILNGLTLEYPLFTFPEESLNYGYQAYLSGTTSGNESNPQY